MKADGVGFFITPSSYLSYGSLYEELEKNFVKEKEISFEQLIENCSIKFKEKYPYVKYFKEK